MPLQHNAFHTQNRVDATRLEDTIVNTAKAAVANFYGTAEPTTKLVAELANELAVEPYVECMKEGRKLIFVFGKNTIKRCFKKEMN